MEKVLIDAQKIMEAPDPVQAIAALFDVQIHSMEDLRIQLQTSDQNRIVEVVRWKDAPAKWEPLADLLEGVQQHSNYFYLIWGTDDDYVNTHATGNEPVLENPPQVQLV